MQIPGVEGVDRFALDVPSGCVVDGGLEGDVLVEDDTETLANTLGDDETDDRTLDETGEVDKSALAISSWVVDEWLLPDALSDCFDVENKTFDSTSEDAGTVGKTLVKSVVKVVKNIGVVELWGCEVERELAGGSRIDCLDTDVETFTNILDDSEPVKTTVVKSGAEVVEAVALPVLWGLEEVTELVANALVECFDIENEMVTECSGDENTEGRTLDESADTPADADCDETKGNTLDESTVTPTDAVALLVLCDDEMATKRVADCFDIKEETLTNIEDKDETEGRTLDEYGVTTPNAVTLDLLCDGKTARERSADCFVMEVVTLTNISDVDETEGRILDESGVAPRDAVALDVLCDCEIFTELVADCFDIEDKTLADTSDNDETAGRPVDEPVVVAMGIVASVLVWDCEVYTQLPGDSLDIVDETSPDSSDDGGIGGLKNIVATCVRGSSVSESSDDDNTEGRTLDESADIPADADCDETKGNTLDESTVTPTDAVALPILCDDKMATERVADCFDMEVVTLTNISDDDETEGRILDESGVAPRDAMALGVL